MTTRTWRGARLGVAALALLVALPLAACSDEDGDGATTDEEIEKVEKGVDGAEEQIRQEIDGQDKGSNHDNEEQPRGPGRVVLQGNGLRTAGWPGGRLRFHWDFLPAGAALEARGIPSAGRSNELLCST